MMWLADPTTRAPMAAIPDRGREMAYPRSHWRPGWRSGIERAADGTPLRMWFAICQDDCCAEVRATWPELR